VIDLETLWQQVLALATEAHESKEVSKREKENTPWKL